MPARGKFRSKAGTLVYSGEIWMKVREIIELLEEDGWYIVAIEGSHRQFKHPVKRGKVTVAGKMSDDIKKGTLASILRQARLK